MTTGGVSCVGGAPSLSSSRLGEQTEGAESGVVMKEAVEGVWTRGGVTGEGVEQVMQGR